MSVIEHKGQAPRAVACFVLTVSDTRTEANDTGGQTIRELLECAGHSVSGHAIVKDEAAQVAAAIRERLADQTTQVIITTGGTGITSRDTTYEALTALFTKRIDGFGELFRMLSFQEIGSAAMMSRATAGVIGRCAVFVLPGSENAVRLAMTRLILPELGHVARELGR